MRTQKMRHLEAALLAALLLILGACGDKPSGGPSADSASPAVSQGEPQSPLPGSGSPAPEATTPAPVESIPPESTPSAPEVSDSPAPVESNQPSQSDLPATGTAPTAPDGSVPVPPSGATAEGTDVGNDWFADAVFLGDSRTDGLRLYSGIKGASFICHTGLSVFTVGTNACINSDTGKITAMDALAKQQWAKVYLMLGVNELGYSTASFKDAYTKVVQQIKTIQPGASIYLQTLIPINEPIAYQNGTNRAINNAKLKEFNQVIAEIAQSEGVLLVDVDTPFWSAEGCLAAENTGDGVHLTRAGYQSWFAYLRTHTAPAATTTTFTPPWSDIYQVPPEETWPASLPPEDPWASVSMPGGM